jgi:2-C-methyl-D-erythritol 4-phosphate cytidylyltransferase
VTVALILAAGRGERLGANGPKAFVPLAGRPLLSWSLDTLRRVEGIERIVLALPPEDSSGTHIWTATALASTETIAVAGGTTRSESVRLALAAAGSGDPVLVHDAARPLLTRELAERVIAAALAEGVDAAIAAAPVTDTIKRARVAAEVGEGEAEEELHTVLETLDRSGLWAVQTPQVFRRAALERALDVPDEVLAQATDDAWLVERAGGRVVMVQAPAENLKITTPLDLTLAELLIAGRA